MKISINNVETEIAAGTTLQQLADSHRLPERGVAIAVNNELTPRAQWDSYELHDGDSVTIVRAFCGG